MNDAGWHIIGSDDLAQHLSSATRRVPSDGARTVVTEADVVPEGAIATGRAMTVRDAQAIVPHLAGFRVVDELIRSVHNDEVGLIYGCYGSMRVPRGTSPDEVAHDALLPLLATALEIVSDDVTDVWARRASLLAEGDAWFVTIHLGSVIMTLEALATTDDAASDSFELLLEVTGSEQVIRAEPFRQAVTVAPFNGPARSHGWLEDAGERLLHRILDLDDRPMQGSAQRLQTVWEAVHTSAATGQPVALS